MNLKGLYIFYRLAIFSSFFFFFFLYNYAFANKLSGKN